MARVNVEERLFAGGRIARLARKMAWPEHAALGALVYLWHDSQAEMRVGGDAQEIVTWSRLDAEPDDVAARWVRALGSIGFIRDDPSGGYLIDGNAHQVSTIGNLSNARSMGGAATKRRWAEAQRKLAELREREGCQQASQPGMSRLSAGSMQCSTNSMQSNAEAEKENTAHPPPARSRARVKATASAADFAAATAWLEHAVAEMPWRASSATWTADAFAVEIAAIKKATDLNDDGIAAVIAFIKRDTFWKRNAVTPSGVLKSRNGVRKIDHILAQMKPATDSTVKNIKAWAEEIDHGNGN